VRPDLHRQLFLPGRLALLLSPDQRCERLHREWARDRAGVPVLLRERVLERVLRSRRQHERQPGGSLRLQGQ
jgi:hypothetical protein